MAKAHTPVVFHAKIGPEFLATCIFSEARDKWVRFEEWWQRVRKWESVDREALGICNGYKALEKIANN